MRGAPGEDEIGAGVGERRRHHDFPEARRMPGDGDVGVVEGARAHHEGLCRAAFFRGAAVIAHAPRHLVLGEPVLHGGGGEQRGGTEQIVAAAMAVAAGLQRARLGHAGLLAEAGQRVIFAEEGDDGPAFAPFAHQRGGNACDLLGDAETLMAQLGQMFGGRARLGVAHLGHRPDPVGQGDETRLDGVDATPDVTAVIHLPISNSEGDVSLELLSASQNDASAGRTISHAAGAGRKWRRYVTRTHMPVTPSRHAANSRPFSTTSTTASAASVQRKKPVANGSSVPS